MRSCTPRFKWQRIAHEKLNNCIECHVLWKQSNSQVIERKPFSVGAVACLHSLCRQTNRFHWIHFTRCTKLCTKCSNDIVLDNFYAWRKKKKIVLSCWAGAAVFSLSRSLSFSLSISLCVMKHGHNFFFLLDIFHMQKHYTPYICIMHTLICHHDFQLRSQ